MMSESAEAKRQVAAANGNPKCIGVRCESPAEEGSWHCSECRERSKGTEDVVAYDLGHKNGTRSGFDAGFCKARGQALLMIRAAATESRKQSSSNPNSYAVSVALDAIGDRIGGMLFEPYPKVVTRKKRRATKDDGKKPKRLGVG